MYRKCEYSTLQRSSIVTSEWHTSDSLRSNVDTDQVLHFFPKMSLEILGGSKKTRGKISAVLLGNHTTVPMYVLEKPGGNCFLFIFKYFFNWKRATYGGNMRRVSKLIFNPPTQGKTALLAVKIGNGIDHFPKQNYGGNMLQGGSGKESKTRMFLKRKIVKMNLDFSEKKKMPNYGQL